MPARHVIHTLPLAIIMLLLISCGSELDEAKVASAQRLIRETEAHVTAAERLVHASEHFSKTISALEYAQEGDVPTDHQVFSAFGQLIDRTITVTNASVSVGYALGDACPEFVDEETLDQNLTEFREHALSLEKLSVTLEEATATGSLESHESDIFFEAWIELNASSEDTDPDAGTTDESSEPPFAEGGIGEACVMALISGAPADQVDEMQTDMGHINRRYKSVDAYLASE